MIWRARSFSSQSLVVGVGKGVADKVDETTGVDEGDSGTDNEVTGIVNDTEEGGKEVEVADEIGEMDKGRFDSHFNQSKNIHPIISSPPTEQNSISWRIILLPGYF